MLSSAKVVLSVNAVISAATPNALAPANAALNYTRTSTLGSGVAVDTADKVYVSSGTVANGSPVSVDFSGSLVDTVGDSAVFAELVTVCVVNKSTTVGQILSLTGNLVTTAFGASTSIPVGPGGMFLIHLPAAAAITVTNSSADVLTLTSAAGTISYDLIVLGRSA